MKLSEDEDLVLLWMTRGYRLRWCRGGRLSIGRLMGGVSQEAKDALLNKGLIRREVTFSITPAGREAVETSRTRENGDE